MSPIEFSGDKTRLLRIRAIHFSVEKSDQIRPWVSLKTGNAAILTMHVGKRNCKQNLASFGTRCNLIEAKKWDFSTDSKTMCQIIDICSKSDYLTRNEAEKERKSSVRGMGNRMETICQGCQSLSS